MLTDSEELSEHVLQQINPFLNAGKATKILIGYSGGLDSTVLLHVVAGLAVKLNPATIEPIHVNHGINQLAGQWVKHCQSFCKSLDLSLVVCDFSLGRIKSNREAVYRQARYKAFRKHLGESDLLLTAHHQRDQVETVLFNLFRGAGVSGLKGMLPSRSFVGGSHLRPLLSTSPQYLVEYARRHELAWIDDPSNREVDLDRNYIRHKVLPVIKKHWPAVENSISRSAELMCQADSLLTEIAQQDIANAVAANFPGVIKDLYLSVIDLKTFSSLSEHRQFNFLKHWIKVNTSLSLSNDQLVQIYQDLCQKPQSNGLFELSNIEIRVFKGYLYLMEKVIPSETAELEPIFKENCFLFERLGLCIEIQSRDTAELQFRHRQGGERLRQNNQTKSLKTIYQQQSIPTWERDLIPLIFKNNQLIAAPGIAYADESVVQSSRLIKYMPENA